MKFEAKELFAILIVLLFPLGIGQFVAKSTLPEYGAAVQMRLALSGAAAEPHIAVAAALEKVYASAMGLDASSAQAIAGFLLIFPPVLLALVSVLLYLACRQMAYGMAQSALAALLLALSLSVVLSFMPGVYGSASLGALLFAAFMLPFAMFLQKPGNMAALGAAAVLALCAAYLNAVFALAGVAMVASFAFAHHKKKEEKNYLAMLGVLALLFAAAGYLSPDKSLLSFAPEGLAQIANGMPFLFAAAAICLGLFFFGKKDAEYLALVLLGAALFGFSPLAGSLLLVLPAAEGVARATGDVSASAKLAAVFACGFFMVLGLTFPQMGAYSAIAAAAMLGLLAPLTLHFYDYNSKAILAVMGAGLLLLSAFFAIFIQLPPSKAGYPNYTDPALSQALSYLSGKGATQLATLERVDAIAFYLPGIAKEKAASTEAYLLSGNASMAPGAYLLFSLPTLEELSQKGGFEVYYYAQNYTNGGTTYALFVSQQGRLISRELAPGGKFALKDGAALDSRGAYYAPIPLTRMAMLSDSKPYSDKANRMLLLEDGGAPPFVSAICSGRASGVKLDKEFSGVAVYSVQ